MPSSFQMFIMLECCGPFVDFFLKFCGPVKKKEGSCNIFLTCLFVWLIEAPVYQASEKSLPTPPAFAMSNSVTDKFNPRHSLPMLGEDYPERPGQPECSYFIKTGDCKYRSNCKFHHPKAQLTRTQTLLNDKGLPLRPVSSFFSSVWVWSCEIWVCWDVLSKRNLSCMA